MPKALVYARVSDDRAGGRSPAEQEHEARQVCAREGWDVAEVITDSVGASRHSKGARPGWKRAKEMVKSRAVDVLVTWECSRAQRDLAAYAELRELCFTAGVLWSYSGRTHDLAQSDDRFRTGLDALLAEREADETSGRVRRAMRANAVQGRPHGRRLLGYRRVYDPTSGVLTGQEPEPAEASMVWRIFAGYLGGQSLQQLADSLNAEGRTTGSGRQWHSTQIHRVLTNPAYAAQRVHQGEIVGEGGWPALVKLEQFQQVQARLTAKRNGRSHQAPSSRLLSGIGRCGVCGGKVHSGFNVKRGKKRRTYICGVKFCVGRDMVMLDDFVTTALLERLALPDATEDLRGSDLTAEVLEAHQRVAELRARLSEATDQFIGGQLSAVTLSRIETELNQQIAEAESLARRGSLPLDIEIPSRGLELWWDDLTTRMRREVIASRLVSVTILPVGSGHGRGKLDPTGVRLDWR